MIDVSRSCRSCGVTKSLGEFVGSTRSRMGRTRECKACASHRTLTHKRRDHPDGYRPPGWKEREVLRDAAKDQPCADCGQSYPLPIMEFDHVRGTKVANVSAMVAGGTTKAFLAELAKCDVVCANCHRMRTWNRRAG